MSALLARIAVPVVVLMAAAAQCATVPGMCCIVRQAVSADVPACCRPAEAAEHVPGRCPMCRATNGSQDSENVAGEPGGSEEGCRWCATDPRTHESDRAAAPAPTLFALAALPPTSEPAAAPAAEPSVSESPPFHRTAIATCAWLCVWRK